MPEAPRRGLVIGCGGTLGFAWTAAVLTALEEQTGWDPRTADVLVGTSAGSEMVAMLGSGRSAAAVLAACAGSQEDPVLARHLAHDPGSLPPLPRLGWPARGLLTAMARGQVDLTAGLAALLPRGSGDPSWLRDLGDALAGPDGWVAHPQTWIVAADAATGVRTAFGSPRAPRVGLGEAIVASWAVPGWFPPVEIGTSGYLDGGTVSTASADLVAPLALDEVYVLAPMASSQPTRARGAEHVERLLRRRMSRGLAAEVETLCAAGTRVVRIEPSQDQLDAMGANFMDASRRARVLATTTSTAPGLLRQILTQGATP